MPEKIRVLFIDDDSFMLKALLRAAMRLRSDWQYFLCDNAMKWQETLSPGLVPDLIVSDFLMPDINGDVVLMQAMQQLPETVRVLMTGDTSEEVVSSVSVQAHFVLSKPFSEQDLENLFECIERLKKLHLPPALRRKLGQAGSLPVLPVIIRKLRHELSVAEPELVRIVNLIAHEPVLAARLMQLANSAFLGFSRVTHSLQEALMRLGLRLVEAIVTLMAVEQSVAGDNWDGLHQQLSEQAFKMAHTAKELAHAAHLPPEEQDLVFVSALLSALGPLSKLQLAMQGNDVLPEQINGISIETIITVYLLTLWGYPTALCQLELDLAQQGEKPDMTDLKQVILSVARDYYQHNNSAFLIQLASQVSHVELKQAILNLPPVAQ